MHWPGDWDWDWILDVDVDVDLCGQRAAATNYIAEL